MTHGFGRTKSTMQGGARTLWGGVTGCTGQRTTECSPHFMGSVSAGTTPGRACGWDALLTYGEDTPWAGTRVALHGKELHWALSSAPPGAAHPCGVSMAIPSGSQGAGATPERERRARWCPGPSRSLEDKHLLIAMATNKPCVVLALLSPWKRSEYHIATCASRTHGNGPVALQHPRLDLCSGSCAGLCPELNPALRGAGAGLNLGRRVPRAAANLGLHGNRGWKVPRGRSGGCCQPDEGLQGACYPVYLPHDSSRT